MKINTKIVTLALFFLTTSSYANWQIEYSSKIINFTGGSKKRGNFASQSACESARNSSARASGDYSNMMRNSWCTGSGSGSSSGGGYSGKYAVQYMFIQSMLEGFEKSLQEEQRQAKLRQQQEQERAAIQRQKEQERFNKGRDAWKKTKEDSLKNKKLEEEKKDAENEALLGQMGLSSPQNELEFMPMNSSSASSSIDTSIMKPLDRANCAAYFANKAAMSNDMQKARYYTQQSENVSVGGLIEEGCQNINAENIPDASPPMAVMEDAESVKRQQREMQEIIKKMQDLEELEKLDEKITQTKERKKEVTLKREEAIKKIEEIKKLPPEKKEELDTSLAEAEKLLQDSENELSNLENMEKELTNNKIKVENEMKKNDEEKSQEGARNDKN